MTQFAAAAAQTGRRTLITGGIILSMDREVGNLDAGDILVDNDRIVAIAPELWCEDAEVIDARERIVVPGFVDAHRHAWQGALRRLMPNVSSLNEYFDVTHHNLAKFYRPADMYVGNLLTAWSCLDAGTTTIVDASHNARSPEHTEACLDALQDAGIRALHMPGKPLAGEWAEHWPQGLERLQAERFASKDQLLTLGVFAQPDPGVWAVARRLGVPILSEFLGPMAPALTKLVAAGEIGPDNIFNHCTSLPVEAWRHLADAGVRITVDPRSDAQYALAGGVFAWQRATDLGMHPGIGTDLETAYGGDMFTEMRVAFSLQRAMAQGRRYSGDITAPAPVTVQAILAAATIDGARCAGLDHQVGSLSIGKQADLVLVRTDSISMFPSNNAAGSVVHAADRSDVDSVMVAGRFRKRAGKLVGIDMGALRRSALASLHHLYEASGYVPDQLAERLPALSGEKPAAWTGS